MSLTLRGNKWHMRFQVKGVPVAESTRTSNKREAENIAAMARAELVRDLILAKARPIKLHAALDEFLTTRAGTPGYKNAWSALKRFKVVQDRLCSKVELHELNAVIDGMKGAYALSTVKITVNYWNAFAKWCKDVSYVHPPMIEAVRGVRGKVRWLSLEEQKALLRAIPSRDNRELVTLLLDTGARYAEIAGMQWQQVDLNVGTVLVRRGKGGADTVLALTARAKAVLTRRRGIDAHWVFPLKHDTNNSTAWMQRAVAKAGLSTEQGSINCHTMRHTAASMWLQNGLSLSEVSWLLGHSNIQQTQKYAHFIKSDAASKAAAIMNALAK